MEDETGIDRVNRHILGFLFLLTSVRSQSQFSFLLSSLTIRRFCRAENY